MPDPRSVVRRQYSSSGTVVIALASSVLTVCGTVLYVDELSSSWPQLRPVGAVVGTVIVLLST